MVEFLNMRTGTKMWVHESKVDEYKAAGHIPAADIVDDEAPVEKPKRKRTVKKKEA